MFGFLRRVWLPIDIFSSDANQTADGPTKMAEGKWPPRTQTLQRLWLL
jgi:hypothetical protein